ncbi:MAG TPA: hypothetical protein VF652_07940 [Allosphingosinicella sp.]
MNRLRRLLVAAAAIGYAPAATAAEIDLDALCSKADDGVYTIPPFKLRNAALDPVGWDLFTRDDGTIDTTLAFQALAYSGFCGAGLKVCVGENEADLRKARNFIRGVLRHPQISVVERNGAPERHEAALAGTDPEEFWKVLDPRFATITCDVEEREEVEVAPAAGKGPATLFLLAKDIGDLTLPRGTVDDLKGVPQAEISYADDNEGKTETFQLHGTAGLRIPFSRGNYLIPFVQFVRSHVEDSTGVEPSSETSKLAVGLLSQWQVATYDRIEVSALYANDLEDGNEVVAAQLAWRPGFLYGLKSFRGAWHFCRNEDRGVFGCRRKNVLGGVKTDARLIATAGHVLDVGDDPALVDNRDFLRVGGEARLTLFGSRGVIRDMSVDVGYRHLFGLAGKPDNLSGFTAGVNYWIAGSPHVSLRLGYERSRDEETLERTNQWTVALGARF